VWLSSARPTGRECRLRDYETLAESAVGKTRDEDPMLAREMLGLDAEMHTLEPVVYSPTVIHEAVRGRENPEEIRERTESFDDLAADTDHMVVEGGGRLSTGGIVGLTDVDIAELLESVDLESLFELA